VPDRPGELATLLTLLANERVNVVEVEHQRETAGLPVAMTGVELTLVTRDAAHCDEIVQTLGRWGYPLFWVSLAIGCIGAALEISLDVSYIVSQSFGWDWGESQKPAEEARFALIYTLAMPIAAIPALIGLDPLKLTMFSMALTVIALPIVVGPLIVIMNDEQYLQQHTNGWITNMAVIAIVLVAFVLAVLAIPLQIAGS